MQTAGAGAGRKIFQCAGDPADVADIAGVERQPPLGVLESAVLQNAQEGNRYLFVDRQQLIVNQGPTDEVTET